MKEKRMSRLAIAGITIATVGVCQAQTLGYLSGYLNDQYTLASFSTATGEIVNSFLDGLGNGSTFAVSSDGLTLYVPGSAGTYPNLTGVINRVSAQTGETLNSIALAFPAQKVVAVGNGSKAFALEQADSGNTIVVQAVDLTVGAVVGSIVLPSQSFRFPVDIAVSPNGSRLFVALECGNNGSCSSPLPGPCTINKGLCIYDGGTLGFVAEAANPTGLLSISQDSNSLYIAPLSGDPESLFVLNTQTLTKSKIQLGGFVSGPPVISPLGEYAVVFISSNIQSKAAILNTITNQFVKTLFSAAPGGSGITSGNLSPLGVNTLAAFSTDGQSIWAVVNCTPGFGCTLPDGATRALAGFAFPSGATIAVSPLPVVPGINNLSIAFPQVVKQ